MIRSTIEETQRNFLYSGMPLNASENNSLHLNQTFGVMGSLFGKYLAMEKSPSTKIKILGKHFQL
jgi:hypothetical protein